MTDFERYAVRIRRLICKMFIAHKDGHIGGSFSIVEVMSVLFSKYLKNTLIKEDWFVLSKGHAGPAYYAALALIHYYRIKSKEVAE